MTEYWNYIVTAIGIIGFYFAGQKKWWCWYINIFNQILWFTFGLVTGQWGFVLGSIFYTIVFTKNAVVWTRERQGVKKKRPKYGEKIGEVNLVEMTEDGLLVRGRIFPEYGDVIAQDALKGFSLGPSGSDVIKNKLEGAYRDSKVSDNGSRLYLGRFGKRRASPPEV